MGEYGGIIQNSEFEMSSGESPLARLPLFRAADSSGGGRWDVIEETGATFILSTFVAGDCGRPGGMADGRMFRESSAQDKIL